MKTKARKSNKAKRRIFFAFLLFFSLLIALFSAVFKDWTQIIRNQQQTKILSAKYNSLLKQETSLESEVNKLQDPEYVARYAREKYLLSKEGEIIIKIPDSKVNKDK